MSQRPTICLVHGSWHCPDHFGPLMKDLEGHGYKCVPVPLPSTQSEDLPPATLDDDTNAVRNTVLAELKSNHVIVVAHSYGGCPANNALKELDLASRTAASERTAVLHIVFLCAMPLPAGVSFLDGALRGNPEPLHDLSHDPRFSWVGPRGPHVYFYNDLPETETKWSQMLRPQSWKAYEGLTSYAAYNDFPCSYLHTEKDIAFPIRLQRLLVESVIAGGAQIRTEVCNAGHSPFLSQVEITSRFIRGAAGEEVGK